MSEQRHGDRGRDVDPPQQPPSNASSSSRSLEIQASRWSARPQQHQQGSSSNTLPPTLAALQRPAPALQRPTPAPTVRREQGQVRVNVRGPLASSESGSSSSRPSLHQQAVMNYRTQQAGGSSHSSIQPGGSHPSLDRFSEYSEGAREMLLRPSTHWSDDMTTRRTSSDSLRSADSGWNHLVEYLREAGPGPYEPSNEESHPRTATESIPPSYHSMLPPSYSDPPSYHVSREDQSGVLLQSDDDTASLNTPVQQAPPSSSPNAPAQQDRPDTPTYQSSTPTALPSIFPNEPPRRTLRHRASQAGLMLRRAISHVSLRGRSRSEQGHHGGGEDDDHDEQEEEEEQEDEEEQQEEEGDGAQELRPRRSIRRMFSGMLPRNIRRSRSQSRNR